MSTAVTALPRPGRREIPVRFGGERGRRIRQHEHGRGERARDEESERGGCGLQRRPGRSAGLRQAAEPFRGRHKQHASDAAADGGFGERHVGGVEAHPDDRQHEPVGDEAHDRAERLARRDRPGGYAEHDGGEAEIERAEQH